MKINPICYYNKRNDTQHLVKIPKINFTSRVLSNNQNIDSVTFNGVCTMKPSTLEKMTSYAIEILKTNNLKKGQNVFIQAESHFLPFMEVLSKEAYKMGSGIVIFNVIEPELEELKHKYNIEEEFDYKKAQLEYVKNTNSLIFNFDQSNNPYEIAKITTDEVEKELEKISPIIPKEIRDIFKVSPEEILKKALDIHEGQPVFIKGEREHLPLIIELANYIYKTNNSKLISVSIANNNYKNLLEYGDDSLLEYVAPYDIKMYEEYYEKDVAWLQFDGSDPKEYENIDSTRINKNKQARNIAIEEPFNKTMTNVPWLVYYAPTTKSIKDVYKEYSDPMDALAKAYEDANKINRIGQLEEHISSLDYRAQKMNEILEKGFRTLHYVSVDENTKLPDGKTDFTISLSPKSIFNACRMEMPKYGHRPIVNIPSEEIFTSPDANSAQGVVSATLPLSLNGQIVDGIQLTFKDGQVIDIHADKNEDMLKEYIKGNKNADRLGEVALVAGSPIAALGRLFNLTLLDENAACHLALGNAYTECVLNADDIEDPEERKQYLASLNINTSPTHTDFMIGGANVYISAINKDTNEVIDIIKDDQFLL